MKKKIILILIILLIPLFGGISSAVNLVSIGDWSLSDKYSVYYGGNEQRLDLSVDEVIQYYKKNSPEYKKIDLTHELNSLYFSSLEQQLNGIDNAIIQNKKLIEENRSMLEDYQKELELYEEGSAEWQTIVNNMETCALNIATYENLLIDYTTQKAELYTQYENYRFLNDYAELLFILDQSRLLNNIKEKCFSLIVLKENLDSVDDNISYNNVILQIHKENFKHGRSTESDIQLQDSLLELSRNQKDLYKTTYNNTFKDILRNIGFNEDQNIKISFDIKTLRSLVCKEFDIVKSSFYANDIKEKQLKNNIAILDGKIKILNEIYPPNSQVLELESKNREIAILEHHKWLLERDELLRNIYSDYENKYYDVKYKEKAAEAQYKKYLVALNKYNLGLISRIEYLEEKLKFNQYEMDVYMALYEYYRSLNRVDLAMLGLITNI